MLIRKGRILLFLISLVLLIFIFTKRTRLQSGWGPTSYDEWDCGCPRLGPRLALTDKASLCSEWSTSRGEGQKVIAYTVYGNYNNEKVMKQYYSQIEYRIKEANFYYEGWIVRLYHNTTKWNNSTKEMICRLFCQYPSFDPCHVNWIPIPDGWANYQTSLSTLVSNGTSSNSLNGAIFKIVDFFTTFTSSRHFSENLLREESVESFDEDFDPETDGFGTLKSFGKFLHGKLWRFLPLGDDTVDVFLVRDVDSFILPREVAAVEQWLHNSTALVHAMRDHPSHNGAILAGMWGGARWRDRQKMTGFLKRLLIYPPRNIWNYDQIILKRVIWPDVIDRILVHDSYHCRTPFLQAKHRALPFPTKRRGHLFVSWGPNRSPSELRDIVSCPGECRPRDHPEWKYC